MELHSDVEIGEYGKASERVKSIARREMPNHDGQL